MLWIIALGICVIYLLRLYVGSGSSNGSLDGRKPLYLMWTSGSELTASVPHGKEIYFSSANIAAYLFVDVFPQCPHGEHGNPPQITYAEKKILAWRLQGFAVLVTSIVLCLAMYAFHKRKRMGSARALLQAKEAPCEQRTEAEPAAPSFKGDVPATAEDVMSFSSSSWGDGERLSGGAWVATPVIGSWQRGPVQTASRVVNTSRSSTVTTPATPTTPRTSLARPPAVAHASANAFWSPRRPSPKRLYLPSSTGAAFGKLLSACHQRSPAKFAQLFNTIEADRFKKIAEGKNSEVFRIFTYKGDSVLKVGQLDCEPESLDHLQSKMTIAMRLTELRKKQDCFTTGFVELRSVMCVFDAYPQELLVARETAARTAKQERRHARRERTERAYLAWHLSYAGVPLDQIELENVLQLFSVLQQVMVSLVVAEEALEFEHRALQLGHVLIRKTHEKSSSFSFGGRSLDVNTSGIEVHVAGYSSARISDGGAAVFTMLGNASHNATERSLLCVYKNMANIIRDDWHSFHPLTNLLWVRHMMKELYRQYEPKFRNVNDRYEALAWSDIGSWRDQLLDYCCLGDFVKANFKA